MDHSDFTARDELEYQTLRQRRENDLMQMYNNQGITDNYPQYTTNFWGDAGNNYGFGSSNISSAVTNHPAMHIMPVTKNNYDTDSTNTRKRDVYQSLSGFASDNQRWYENNPQKNSFNYVQDNYENNKLVNDCLKSDRFKQFVSNIKQPVREGIGFSNPDQPTNSGISENWYNSFRMQNPSIAQNYPAGVQYLTQEQIDNLYCQGFYKPLHNEIINDDFTSEHIFDIGVNVGESNGIPIIQNAVNDITNLGINTRGGIGTETVSAINNIPHDDLIRFNNRIVDRRRKYYDKLNNPEYPGWYPRAELFRR